MNFILWESLPPFWFCSQSEFFFPSLWVPPLHWSSSESCLANHTGFSDYNSVISIAGKTCTGRTALGGDFPALGTLLFEASPHRFKLTFFSQLFEIQLPVIWLCPDFNSSLYHLPQVPITSTQPSHSFCYWESGGANQWPRSPPPPAGRLKFQMERQGIVKHSAFNSKRLSPCIRTAKVPSPQFFVLLGQLWSVPEMHFHSLHLHLLDGPLRAIKVIPLCKTWADPGQVYTGKANFAGAKGDKVT